MSGSNHEGLAKAIALRERAIRAALDQLRDMAPEDKVDDAYALARTVREAVEFMGSARRLLPNRTVNEIHHAFGAPGDYGYGTPVGDALSLIYRGGGG